MSADQQQLPPPPPALLSTEGYGGYSNCNETSPAAATTLATSYVTIGMLTSPAPPPPIATTATTPGSTSTFKTPLLPMPTLEDIEGGLLLPNTQPIPGGILKYPTCSSATSNQMPMNLPMSMAMGPGPPNSIPDATMHIQPPPLPPTTLALNDATTCGTLKSNAKLLHGASPPPPPVPLMAAASVGGLANNIAAGSNNCTAAGSSSHPSANKPGNASRGSYNSNKPASKCCACFGRSATPVKSKKRSRQKAQSLWSALLTNLGICALLLAYTLLGSFIFLTIESDDSSGLLHHQRTLASTTKRVGGGGRGSGAHQPVQSTLNNGSSASLLSSLAAKPQTVSIEDMAGNADSIYGDDGAPQLALSADTYDVRQRTIENIWDITVSLNILYKENWTKLAALEIAKFQDQLIKRLNEDALLQLTHDADVVGGNNPATEAVLLHTHHHWSHEWDFAKAFLYSLTVLTTIGYGNIAPRTTLGRLVTLVYAMFGIPLTLVYLSSTGGILAKIAREVFSKALCCCLCSNCGYCCYDEKRMAEKERRMKRKRQQEELRKQHAAMQEPYYVRSGSMHESFQTPEKHSGGTSAATQLPDIDSLSASESRGSMHGLSILAPILLCLSMMIIYIVVGALVLYRLENWPLIDGIYFCFMSLSTIGFGDMLPGLRRESTTTTWFCSIYIMVGMALTAMCFNVIHEEIVHRIKIVVEFKKGSSLDTTEEQNYYLPP